MAVAITRDDLTASDLRLTASRCADSAVARRALALALVVEGKSRSESARSAGMDRQTLRDWVHRYNELGLDGLKNRPNQGAPPHRNNRWRRGCGRGRIGSAIRWCAGG